MDKNTLVALKNLFTTYDDASSWKEKIATRLSYLIHYTYLFILLALLALIYLTKNGWYPLPVVLVLQAGLCGFFMYINFLILKYRLHTRIIAFYRIMNLIYLFFIVSYTIMLSLILDGEHAIVYVVLFYGIPILVFGLVALLFGMLSFRQLEKHRKELKAKLLIKNNPIH